MYVCVYYLIYWVWWFTQLLMYSVGSYKSWTGSTRTASAGRINPDRLHVMLETVADLKLNWLLILRGVTDHVSTFLLRILTVAIPS